MSEIKAWGFWRAVLAECLGTIVFVFVFIGLSAAIGDRNNSYPDQEIKVALAFGLAVATLAQCLGHVSAAHLNPAITLGLLVSCKISPLRALVYMSAQVVGAVAGSVIVYGTRPETTHSLGVNKVYWAVPMCAGVVAALLYDYLLAPRKDPCGEKTRGLLCCGSKQEKDHREPLLEEGSGEF
uniref:aquaporin-2-like n=1 Tax=Gasterosteus aculeatus aculeatus TaxID=481459 RepID=UPI001A98334B|nr:aquaporin-2-like [Gasterosteus aculeatus aculeatus]